MNNSLLKTDEEVLKQDDVVSNREAKLVRMVEAIARLSESSDWEILKEEIFDPVTKNLESRLMSEVKSEKINEPEIYRLQGQLVWARKYSNLETLKEVFKVELVNIRKTYGK
jgi:hypothetical protein